MSMATIDTPFGPFKVPEGIQAGLDATSDVDLLETMWNYEQDTGFIEPFVFNELLNRGLCLDYVRLCDERKPQPPKRSFNDFILGIK